MWVEVLDIDFEYSTETNKIGLLDAKGGRDISYIPGSKFWKTPLVIKKFLQKLVKN